MTQAFIGTRKFKVNCKGLLKSDNMTTDDYITPLELGLKLTRRPG